MSPERIRPGSAGKRGGGEEPKAPEAPSGELPEGLADAAAPVSDEHLPEEVAAAAVEEIADTDTDADVDDDAEHEGEIALDEGALDPDAAELEAVFEVRADEGDDVTQDEIVLEPTPAVRGRLAPSPRRSEPAPAAEDEAFAFAPAAPEHDSWWRRLYFGRTHFDFVRRRNLWFAISGIVLLAGVVSLAVRGLNLSIDFVGGTAWTVQVEGNQVNAARSALTPYGLGGATITQLGGAGAKPTLEVQAKAVTGGTTSAAAQHFETEVAKALGKVAHTSYENVSIQQVGPSWGSQITNKAIEALIVFFILIAIYISIFFEWRMAFAAIVAVAHDVLVTVGIYSLTQLEVTPDTVVAVLTILGYSLYDTIVVFDRVRDNMRQLGSSNKLTVSDLVNLSMNQTLARSINTSLVAILPILAVLILGAELLGATTLQYFGFALIIGLTSGAYSSIFIASPLVALMKEREPRWRTVRERLAARGGDRLLLSPADIAAGILTPEGGLQRSSRAEQRKARAEGRIRPGAARTAAGAAGEPAPTDGVDQPGRRVPTSSGARAGGGRPGTRPGGGRPAARSRRKGGRR